MDWFLLGIYRFRHRYLAFVAELSMPFFRPMAVIVAAADTGIPPEANVA
jgi:hypothetical protein